LGFLDIKLPIEVYNSLCARARLYVQTGLGAEATFRATLVGIYGLINTWTLAFTRWKFGFKKSKRFKKFN
jgi:hypothetical protein